MKKIFLLLFLTKAVCAFAQTEPANYSIAVLRFQQFFNRNQPDSIFKMLSPEVKAMLPADKNRQMVSQLQGQLGKITQLSFEGMDSGIATYKATFDKSVLAMKVSINDKSQFSGLVFDNYKDPNTPKADKTSQLEQGETAFAYKTPSATIYGTLTVPQNINGKVPVVLIIPGSGPTDRNGNGPKLNTNTYKQLAVALAKNGIASLRYDKRLIGESTSATRESQMRIDNYIDDAIGLIGQLHDDQRFSKVIVLGHSEGSLIGMVASDGQPVDALISVAGAGQPAYYILKEQMKSQPEYISKPFNRILDSLARGKTQDNVDASLYAYARPSIQPYLMSWIRYDPSKALKRLKIPVLIIQGNTDLQVGVGEAERLKKAKSDAVLLIIPNMNHIMKEAPVEQEKNLATYTDPNLPLKPEVVTGIVNFIHDKVK